MWAVTDLFFRFDWEELLYYIVWKESFMGLHAAVYSHTYLLITVMYYMTTVLSKTRGQALHWFKINTRRVLLSFMLCLFMTDCYLWAFVCSVVQSQMLYE